MVKGSVGKLCSREAGWKESIKQGLHVDWASQWIGFRMGL